jgi:hypothetical protein
MKTNWAAMIAFAMTIAGVILAFMSIGGVSFDRCSNGCFTISSVFFLIVALAALWLGSVTPMEDSDVLKLYVEESQKAFRLRAIVLQTLHLLRDGRKRLDVIRIIEEELKKNNR